MEQVSSPSPRTPLNLDITFKKSYGRSPCVGRIINISLSGAFIELEGLPLASNEKINVNIEVAGRKRKLPAFVVWKNNQGCGIKFNHASNRDIQIIDDLIYFAESLRSDRREVVKDILKKVA